MSVRVVVFPDKFCIPMTSRSNEVEQGMHTIISEPRVTLDA